MLRSANSCRQVTWLGACALALVAMAPAPATAGAPGPASALKPAPSRATIPGDEQLIVTWSAQSTAAQQAAVLASAGVPARTRLSGPETSSAAGSEPVDVIDVVDASRKDAVSAQLAANPAVLTVEPNIRLHAAGKPALPAAINDPLVRDDSQWGVQGTTYKPSEPFGTDVVSAWARGITGSRKVYVGVIDEGIDISHPDLRKNIFTNPWDPIDGIDNDHNGYVDDIHGWDFYNDDNTLYDGQNHRDFIDAHGTIVAGEIGARGGNGIGVAGVNWDVTIIPAKFLGPDDGTAGGAIAAIDYLTDLKIRHGINLVATNNSWESGGDPDEESPAMQAAIQRGARAGILFVTVSGNGDEQGIGYDLDARPNFPASLNCQLPGGADCMITATAIDINGEKTEFANWGRATVDIGAPGDFIYSTFPSAEYQAYSGTSQAAPFVAGAAALYASRYPHASPTAIRNAILKSAVRTPSLVGKVATNGRLDINAALSTPPRPG